MPTVERFDSVVGVCNISRYGKTQSGLNLLVAATEHGPPVTLTDHDTAET